MKDKKEAVVICALHILWLHPSLLLPVPEVDPEEDEDVEHEGDEGGSDAAEDPDGEGGEAPGVGGCAGHSGQGSVEHVDQDEEGGDQEDAQGGIRKLPGRRSPPGLGTRHHQAGLALKVQVPK